MPSASNEREHAFGELRSPSVVDRFGVWLSARQHHRQVRSYGGLRVGDFGCGYQVTFVRSVLDDVASAVLIDVTLPSDLKAHPKVTAIEGFLPEAAQQVAAASLDVALCTSVLEHLDEPDRMLSEVHRVLAPGGVALINTPSWRGKRFLEFSSFRLGLSPANEIDEHKTYYDPKDLWPMLVHAGFKPRGIRCFRHKFGLNTFAACRVEK